MPIEPLPDEERVKELAKAIMLPIRDNYRRGPIHRDRVYEALNALAFAVALVLEGTNDPLAKEFFDAALLGNQKPMARREL
jgi:hypothetical protein